MLEINKLTIVIDDKTFVDDLNLVLNKQDKLAIIGEEGNGKSTLLKSLVGICDYVQTSGSINIHKHRIGYLKQALSEVELELSVYDFLFDSIEDYVNQCKEFYLLLNQLKLNENIEEQVMSTLSGGEKVKIQLLKILLSKADILLLDEPTNDLDIPTLEWLENFINNYEEGIIFVSHDESLLANCANRILHLEQLNKQSKCRTTLSNIGYKQYIQERSSKYAKDVQVATKEKMEYKQKQEKLNNIRNAVHDALNDTVRNPGLGVLLKSKMKNIKAQEKRFEKEGFSRVDSVEEQIHLFFPKIHLPSKKRILEFSMTPLCIEDHILSKEVHLSIYGPKHIGIIGKNGCGKSTLLNYLYEHLKNSIDLAIGYMPQDYDSLWDTSMRAIDFLCPSQKKDDITQMRQFLGSVNFTREEMVSPISQLSGGSKAKLILLSLIKNAYPILLLDEPTRNVSPLSNPMIRKALINYEGCIISVSHDRIYLQEVCDEVYELTHEGLKSIQE